MPSSWDAPSRRRGWPQSRLARTGLYALPLLAAAFVLVKILSPGDPPGLAWNSLSDEERRVLAAAQTNWNQYSPREREMMADSARLWLSLSSAQQEVVQDRYEFWVEYSIGEQDRLQQGYRRFHSLPTNDQQRVLGNFQDFQLLPRENQMVLRERWDDDGRSLAEPPSPPAFMPAQQRSESPDLDDGDDTPRAIPVAH